jgi:acetate kinase
MSATGQSGTILVLNSGSSSLKFALYEIGAVHAVGPVLFEGSAEGIGHAEGIFRLHCSDGAVQAEQRHVMASQSDALGKLAHVLSQNRTGAPVAVAHRVVHGGPSLREHQVITPTVLRQLRDAVHFAPLHIPAALALIDDAQRIFGGAQHYACFDNAFHRTLPPVASHLPLPRRYADAGVIRYGFHGLSYESLVRRLGSALPARAIFAHLGNGASVCALRDGKSIDTTMGLTPTGGLPMSTRSGDLDPGILLYLMRTEALGVDALEALLNQGSGLAGIADGEGDMQKLAQLSGSGDASATLAIDIFATAVRKTVGAYAALLGGIDLLVFTGGIGEHSDLIRRKVCENLGFLGISADAQGPKVRTMATEETLQMALHCQMLYKAAPI